MLNFALVAEKLAKSLFCRGIHGFLTLELAVLAEKQLFFAENLHIGSNNFLENLAFFEFLMQDGEYCAEKNAFFLGKDQTFCTNSSDFFEKNRSRRLLVCENLEFEGLKLEKLCVFFEFCKKKGLVFDFAQKNGVVFCRNHGEKLSFFVVDDGKPRVSQEIARILSVLCRKYGKLKGNLLEFVKKLEI